MIRKLEFDSADQLVSAAVEGLKDLIADVDSDEKLRVLLTGGSLGIAFCQEAAKRSLDLSKVDFYFGDERFVPLSDPDRNEAQALRVWPELAEHLTRFPDSDIALDEAAASFEKTIASRLGPLSLAQDVFDLTILGMGPDGHVASLFPGHSLTGDWVVAEPSSPKPPSRRLSFSFGALNKSKRVWFLVSGSSKAAAVKSALVSQELPAGRVRGSHETVWFMDRELTLSL